MKTFKQLRHDLDEGLFSKIRDVLDKLTDDNFPYHPQQDNSKKGSTPTPKPTSVAVDTLKQSIRKRLGRRARKL